MHHQLVPLWAVAHGGPFNDQAIHVAAENRFEVGIRELTRAMEAIASVYPADTIRAARDGGALGFRLNGETVNLRRKAVRSLTAIPEDIRPDLVPLIDELNNDAKVLLAMRLDITQDGTICEDSVRHLIRVITHGPEAKVRPVMLRLKEAMRTNCATSKDGLSLGAFVWKAIDEHSARRR